MYTLHIGPELGDRLAGGLIPNQLPLLGHSVRDGPLAEKEDYCSSDAGCVGFAEGVSLNQNARVLVRRSTPSRSAGYSVGSN